MKKILFLLSAIYSSTLISSCSSNPSTTNPVKKDSVVSLTDKVDINDSRFLLFNLKNTKTIPKFQYDDGVVYSDSTKTKKVSILTKVEKLLLLAPYITKQKFMASDVNFVANNFTAEFVAKQNKIGDLQPIIISAGCDDYYAVLLILLDKNNNYVSGYNLKGGLAGGPDDSGDTFISEFDGFAKIDNNVLTTYRLKRTDYKDTTKKTSLIDTTITKVTIDVNGHFREKHLGSKRAVIPSDQKNGD